VGSWPAAPNRGAGGEARLPLWFKAAWRRP
jgi:hypothetical protein